MRVATSLSRDVEDQWLILKPQLGIQHSGDGIGRYQTSLRQHWTQRFSQQGKIYISTSIVEQESSIRIHGSKVKHKEKKYKKDRDIEIKSNI